MKQPILGITIAFTVLVSMLTLPTLVGIRTSAQPPAATQLPAIPMPPSTSAENHLPVQTVQDDQHIVTTVTKSGAPPEGPIVVIPPNETPGGNGTILTPGENITAENPGNVTIITPGGNITEIGNGNITTIDNGTVIIVAPPDRNITETPGNVTIIDPPRPTHPIVLPNETNAGKPCTCNNQTQQPIPPVLITPAPGQNVTTNEPVLGQPAPFPPTNNTTNNNQSGGATQPPANPATGNETNPAGNQTSNTGGNATQTNPPSNSTQSNSTQSNSTSTTPVSSPFLPGFKINAISYNGPNSQYLNR